MTSSTSRSLAVSHLGGPGGKEGVQKSLVSTVKGAGGEGVLHLDRRSMGLKEISENGENREGDKRIREDQRNREEDLRVRN